MPLLCGAEPIETRVLRGGSFNNNQRNARCAYRNNNHPDNRNHNNGFRVVVSHDSHPLPEMQTSVSRSAEATVERRSGSGPGRPIMGRANIEPARRPGHQTPRRATRPCDGAGHVCPQGAVPNVTCLLERANRPARARNAC